MNYKADLQYGDQESDVLAANELPPIISQVLDPDRLHLPQSVFDENSPQSYGHEVSHDRDMSSDICDLMYGWEASSLGQPLVLPEEPAPSRCDDQKAEPKFEPIGNSCLLQRKEAGTIKPELSILHRDPRVLEAEWHKDSIVMYAVEENPILATKRQAPRHSRVLTQAQEDDLKELFKKYGNDWAQIAKEMHGVTRKQIRDRYVNYLKDDITFQPYTQAEDDLIMKLVKKMGTKFSFIASLLPGRTSGSIKNRYHSKLKKLMEQAKAPALPI